MTNFSIARLVLTCSGGLAVAGCATYPSEMTNVFYQVPCGTPGSFQAQIAPGTPAPENRSLTAPVAEPQKATTPPTANEAAKTPPLAADSICLASAGSVPRGYASRAYRYYGDYWRPYRSFGYFGVGFGGGHHGGRHHGGGHHGGGHHGGGRHH